MANHREEASTPLRYISAGPFRLTFGKRTLLMGILNVTPDSFSDGGRYMTVKRAVAHALKMQEEGADILDVGGESTRPGARLISAQEELRRILPVVERLQRKLRIPLSIDTSKAVVAEAALRAGATIVNDVTALKNPRMAEVAAAAGVPVILMHMRGTPQTMHRYTHYRRLIPEIAAELLQSVRKAIAAGVSKGKILIDPGIGFAKGPKENLLALKNLRVLKALGFPIVIGPSRKSFIGKVLADLSEDRIFGTAAAVALGIFSGADVVRVHDVAAMRHVVMVSDAIVHAA